MDKKIILLGLYDTIFFKNMVQKKTCLIYDDFLKLKPKLYEPIDVIKFGIDVSDEIYFILDGIYTPLNTEKSITCQELTIIFNKEKYLNKTTFFLNNDIIPVNKVKEIYYILN